MKHYTIPYVELVWRLDDRDWRLARDCEDTDFDRYTHLLLGEEIEELSNTQRGIGIDTLDIKVPTTRTIDGRSMCMREFIGYKHWGGSPTWFENLRYINTIYFYRDCGRGTVHLGNRESEYERSVPLYYGEILSLLRDINPRCVFDECVVIKFRGAVDEPVSSEWVEDNLITPYRDVLGEIRDRISDDADVRVVVSGVDDVWTVEIPIV